MLMTPVAKRICVVRGMSVARKMSGEVMRSLQELKCSPTKASVKPEAVGEDDGLLVLREDGRVVAVRVVHGHREQAELDGHRAAPLSGFPGCYHISCG